MAMHYTFYKYGCLGDTETTDMIADIFTKCLDKTTFLKFRDQLMTEV